MEGYAQVGRKPDMGKSCVRFCRLEDLPLALIGDAIAAGPPDALIAPYEKSRRRP
jgi:hypothetical protein